MDAFIFLVIGFLIVVGAVLGGLMRGLRADTWKYDKEQLWEHYDMSDQGGTKHS